MYPPEDVIPAFVEEARRVVKRGGLIFSVDVAPGWYGGELANIVYGPEADIELQSNHRLLVDQSGFSYMDVFQTSHYGSLEKIIDTYGFIFGRKVIEYIRENKITSIKWKFRVYYTYNGVH